MAVGGGLQAEVPVAAAPPADSSISEAVLHSSTAFFAHADLVLVPVTVTDRKGRITTGLAKEHFTVYEDMVQQSISHFASEDAPVSISVVLDTSMSMAFKLQKAREAVNAILHNANPDDEFSLIQFSSRPHLVVGLTREKEQVRKRLAAVQPGGSTALLDAVLLGIREMRNAHHVRKAIVIVSDGEDNSSFATVDELTQLVRESDVLIYAIGITDGTSSAPFGSSVRRTGPVLLDAIASQTGGRFFEVRQAKQLPDIASKIGGWLRHQYVIGYSSNSPQRNGRYHQIQVKLSPPKSFPHLQANWRSGYYAPAE
jgi:VWFA-related protein